jgi:hypothetical protein
MDSSALVKAVLLNAAYVGAGDVFANITTIDGTPVNADSGFSDPGVRKKAVAIFEEAKIQYAALIQAFQDKTGVFPDPALPATAGNSLGRADAAVRWHHVGQCRSVREPDLGRHPRHASRGGCAAKCRTAPRRRFGSAGSVSWYPNGDRQLATSAESGGLYARRVGLAAPPA